MDTKCHDRPLSILFFANRKLRCGGKIIEFTF